MNTRVTGGDYAQILVGHFATTKDYIHRIYLDKGIFAEITLYFRNNAFLPGEWSYSDYKTKEYANILTKIREIYGNQLEKI